MTKGQEIIEELGFKLPELDCVENALEIFFVDKHGLIHGRFGWEAIRWNSKGVSSTHPDKFNLVKVNWYDIPSNFPCLVKDKAGYVLIMGGCDRGGCDRGILYNEDFRLNAESATPLNKEEVLKYYVAKGNKC